MSTIFINDNKIATLNLDAIKAKLMHRESGEGWSMERADAVEIEYRRFLYLMKKYPNEETSPSFDVDTFWHYHILDTKKYAADCKRVFGYFLHHYPYLGLGGEDDAQAREHAGERMLDLYERTFGANEAGNRELRDAALRANATPAYCGVGISAAQSGGGATTAYCGAGTGVACRGVPNKFAHREAGTRTAYCGASGPSSPRPFSLTRPQGASAA